MAIYYLYSKNIGNILFKSSCKIGKNQLEMKCFRYESERESFKDVKQFESEVDTLINNNYNVLNGYWCRNTSDKSPKSLNLKLLYNNVRISNYFLKKAKYVALNFNKGVFANLRVVSKLELIIENLRCIRKRCIILIDEFDNNKDFRVDGYDKDDLTINDGKISIGLLCVGIDMNKWIELFDAHIDNIKKEEKHLPQDI